MKKLTTFILAIFYFIFSSGVTMHMHYCMGEFVKFSLSDTNKGVCGKCGMENHDADNGCCRDLQVTAKISDAHLMSGHDFKPLTSYTDLIPPLSPIYADEIVTKSFFSYIPKLNSRRGEIQYYIQFRNLRI